MDPLLERAKILIDRVSAKGKALIIPHLKADVDALASAYVLARILKRKDIDTKIYIESLSEVSSLIIFEHILKSGLLGENDGLIIVVDTSSKDFVPKIVENLFAIIDHHYDIEKMDAELELIDKNSVSTTEIIWRIFKKEVKKEEALFLAAGLYSDTFGLYNTLDIEHIKNFIEMAEMAKIKDISYIKKIALKIPSTEEKIAIHKSIKSMKMLKVKDCLIAYLFHDSPWAVEIADLISKQKLYDVVFVVKDMREIYIRPKNNFSHRVLKLIKDSIKEFNAEGGLNKWRGKIKLPKPISKKEFKKILNSKIKLVSKTKK